MIKAEHKEGKKYDEVLPMIVGIARAAIIDPKKKDDAVFIVAGPTGTGKSNLTMWIVSIFTPKPDPKQITLTAEKFAQSIEAGLKLKKGERYVAYDESDVNRREGMSKWNRSIIKLYFKIREEGFLHVWDHPSPNNIDMEFIRERVNGLFLCFDKRTDKPRRYFFFPKERLLEYLETHDKLSTRGLLKNASKYASYRGSFLAYEGPLLAPYQAQKKEGMREAIGEFAAEWGGTDRGVGLPQAAKLIGMHRVTTGKILAQMIDEGLLDRAEVTNLVGRYALRPNHIDAIKEYTINKRSNSRIQKGLPI